MNPFIYPRALQADEMVGRKKDLRYILGRLINRQSVAVVVTPHMGRTSLLEALQDKDSQQNVVGAQADNLLFSYASGQALHGLQSQAAFWQQILHPLTLLFPPTAPIIASDGLESHLIDMLNELFNDSELRSLCAHLAVDYDTLGGSGKGDKVRELVLHERRRGQLDGLQARIVQERPNSTITTSTIPAPPNDNLLQSVYQTAAANHFGTFVLEQLFRQLDAQGRRLVLLLDEFDDFLAHEALHTAEFYGGLRTLAARSPGLVVVIAARQELETLNKLTQEINPHGSPYFNVFTERRLGLLTQKALAELLAKAGERFKPADRRFVAAISGGHPYLAQVAAFELWELIAEGAAEEARYQEATQIFYDQTRAHFQSTWEVLTNDERKAVTAVALLQMPGLLNGRAFHIERLTAHLSDYTPELDKLRRSGLVKRQGDSWEITQVGFLWWLADEMWRTVRDEDSFTAWLQRQSLDGIFTRGEREWMGEAASSAAKVVEKGVPAIIEAFAKSIAG